MANGKINRQALPLPAHEVPPAQASRYVAPCTPTEIELSNIWSSVLGIQSVGMEDDFVDLGGSSAAGMQCLSRIGKAFSVNLPLGSLLGENSTLRSVAATIDELRSTEVKTAQSSAAG
jgi:acyl carrier protein